MRIEVTKNPDKQYYWKLVSDNNRVLAHSESYVKRSSAIKTATMVAEQGAMDLFIDGKLVNKSRTIIRYRRLSEVDDA